MSAQSRYRTLVANTGAIYAASQDGRTALLERGLYEIVGGIQPANAEQWGLVKTDSERLLKVWFSKEKEQGPAADEVVSQLLDLLKELATPPPPTLVIADVKTDTITHVHDFPQRRLPVPVSLPLSAPVIKVEKVVPLVEVIEEESEEEVAESEVAESEVADSEVAESEVADSEVAESEVAESEVAVEEEVVVEEEEGMEVEQIFIRGRTYWLDSNTQQLYANAEGDEVGDEVGKMVNGKPVFLSK